MVFFVLYDGIGNSVFHSQVLVPIQKFLNEHKEERVTLVSFERGRISPEKIKSIEDLHERLSLVILKKYPVIGRMSLCLSLVPLVRLLRRFRISKIIARGPFAGWIVLKSLSCLQNLPSSVVVQARGLAAEEYRYVHGKKSFYDAYKYRLYKNIEHSVYSQKTVPKGVNFSIETVSPALRKYLICTFNSDLETTSVSTYDIPEPVARARVLACRGAIRDELGIPFEACVYCYSGSAHRWQCIDEIIEFAEDTCELDDDAFFLFLTRDVDIFEKKLRAAGLPRERYLVRFVPHEKIYDYLSAADAGLIYREEDIVNWVSRPTKVLEYRAVGLQIVHNGTVGWLGTDVGRC